MRALALALVLLVTLALLPLHVSAEYHPPLEVTLSVKVNGREVYRNYPSFTLNTFALFDLMLIGQSYANLTSSEREKLFASGVLASIPHTLYTWRSYDYYTIDGKPAFGSRGIYSTSGGGWYPLEVRVAIGDGVPWFYDLRVNDYRPVGVLPFWELGFLGHALANASTVVSRGSNGDRAWLTYSSTFVANGSMRVSEVGLYAVALYSNVDDRVNLLVFYHMLIPPLQLSPGDTLTVEFTVSVGNPFTSHFLDWWLTFLPPSTPFSLSVSTRDGTATLCRNPQWLTGSQSVRDAVLYYNPSLTNKPYPIVVGQGLPVLELGASGDPWSIDDAGVHAPISANVQLNATDSVHVMSPVILKPLRVIASATRLSLIYHVYLNDAVTVREMALMVPTVECTSTSSPPRVKYVTIMRHSWDNPLATPGYFIFEIEMEWGFGSVHAGMSEPLGLVGLGYGGGREDTSPHSELVTVYFRDRAGFPFPLKGNLTVPVLVFVTSNLTTLQDWALVRKYTAGPPQPGWMPTAAFNVTVMRHEFCLTMDRLLVSAPVLPQSSVLVSDYNVPLPAPYDSFKLLSHPVTASVFAYKFTNVRGYDGSLLNLSGYLMFEHAGMERTGGGTCHGPCHPDVYDKFFLQSLPDPLAPIEIPPTGFTSTIYYEVPASFSSLTAYESGGKVTVEGRLVDFYGYPVSNRPVCVTGYASTPDVFRNCTWVYTDSNGYFKADPPQSQTLLVVFPGDSVYLGATQTVTVETETGAYKHRRPGEMIDLRLLALILLLIIITAIAVASVYVKRDSNVAFTIKP